MLEQNPVVFNATVTGLGLCALYYACVWMVKTIKATHEANVLEKNSPALKSMGEQLSQDRSGEAAGSLFTFLGETADQAKRENRLASAGSLLASGAAMYGAYRAARTVVAGEPLGYAAAAIDAVAAAAVVYDGIKRI